MKLGKVYKAVIFMLLVFATIVLSIFLSDKLSPKANLSKDCPQTGTEHQIDIKQDSAQPNVVQASLCDTLTIINEDPKVRLMAFGKHDHHIAVDGITQRLLNQNEQFMITLDKTGTFTVHDHYQDEVQATFVVSK